MIVVLGDEVEEVCGAHGRVQAGMEGGAAEIVGSGGIKSGDERVAAAAKFAEDFFEGLGVVVGLVSFPVQKVGGAQGFSVAFEIPKARGEEFVEIEQVTDIFLDGPFFIGAASENGG